MLAVVETALAVLLYSAICVSRRSLELLAVSSCTAVLLLFRTNESTEWSLRQMPRYVGDLSPFILPGLWTRQKLGAARERMPGMLLVSAVASASMFAYFSFYALCGLTLRTAGVLIYLVRRPLHTVGAVGENWYRQALCTDFAHPPELLPTESLREDLPYPSLVMWVRESVRFAPSRVHPAALVRLIPLLLLGWLPALLYRVSFKATAVVYAPLAFAAHVALGKPLSLRTRIERIVNGEYEKLLRRAGGVVLSALALDQFQTLGLLASDKLPDALKQTAAAVKPFAIGIFPAWKALLAAAFTLSWAMFFFADMAKGRWDSPDAWNEDLVNSTLSAMSFVRLVCALSCVALAYIFFYRLGFTNGIVEWIRGILAQIL